MGYQNVGVAASTPTLNGLPERDGLVTGLPLRRLVSGQVKILTRCGDITPLLVSYSKTDRQPRQMNQHRCRQLVVLC